MTRVFSVTIAWGCLVMLVAMPLGALYFAVNLEAFASIAAQNLSYPIRWDTVTNTQWYSLLSVTILFMGIGWFGLLFLRRAFASFATGEFFTRANSRDLRLFSMLLFAQAAAKPLQDALSSVLLSLNHPPGQRVLSIQLGTNELTVMFLAMLLWVISELLVKGLELETENQQFV